MADKSLTPTPFQNTIADTIETVYSSPITGTGTVITAATLSNNTLSVSNCTLYITPSAVPGTLPQIPIEVIESKKKNISVELLGLVIAPGGELQMSSADAAGIALTASGRDLV